MATGAQRPVGAGSGLRQSRTGVTSDREHVLVAEAVFEVGGGHSASCLLKGSNIIDLFDITLCDLSPGLVRAWRTAFAAFPGATVLQGDLLDVEADAYVSPANSFGIMDGGIDAILNRRFPHVESRVQAAIARVGTMLPVGEALIVETGDPDVPYLVCAPTMELPSRVSHTNNAFRAMHAILSAVELYNVENRDVIRSVAVPGLCTGVGDMAPDLAAMQMAGAYSQWRGNRS